VRFPRWRSTSPDGSAGPEERAAHKEERRRDAEQAALIKAQAKAGSGGACHGGARVGRERLA
jgi:hypothetical protein